MPIYEYRCNACRRRVQLFFRSFSAVGAAVCPHCQSPDLGRLPSRISRVRPTASPEGLLDDPSSLDDLDYENPRAMADWARRMGEASGVDLGSDYEEMLEEIEQGGDMEGLGGMGDDWDE